MTSSIAHKSRQNKRARVRLHNHVFAFMQWSVNQALMAIFWFVTRSSSCSGFLFCDLAVWLVTVSSEGESSREASRRTDRAGAGRGARAPAPLGCLISSHGPPRPLYVPLLGPVALRKPSSRILAAPPRQTLQRATSINLRTRICLTLYLRRIGTDAKKCSVGRRKYKHLRIHILYVSY